MLIAALCARFFERVKSSQHPLVLVPGDFSMTLLRTSHTLLANEIYGIFTNMQEMVIPFRQTSISKNKTANVPSSMSNSLSGFI